MFRSRNNFASIDVPEEPCGIPQGWRGERRAIQVRPQYRGRGEARARTHAAEEAGKTLDFTATGSGKCGCAGAAMCAGTCIRARQRGEDTRDARSRFALARSRAVPHVRASAQ